MRKISTAIDGVREMCRRFWAWAARFAGSSKFFYVIVGVFAFQALWVIFSGAYSMAYDEYYHFGLIKEYTAQGTPFLQQPAGPAELGAVSRDVSFLFHYVMSFPYQIVSYVTSSQNAQIIALRMICLAFFVGGLFAYRTALIGAGISRRMTHGVILFFTLVPTVVMVGAELNYDSLLFLISGLTIAASVAVLKTISVGKTPSLSLLIGTLTLLLAGSITKYAFLPISLSVGVFLLVVLYAARRKINRKQLIEQSKSGIRRPLQWLLIGCFIFVGVMFVDRVGVNVIRYHTPAPDCDQVLSTAQCMGHDPYERNQGYKEAGYSSYIKTSDKLEYPWKWYTQMVRESLFAVGPREAGYATGAPLPLAYWSLMIILPVTVVAVLLRIKMLWKNVVLRMFMIVAISYAAVLFLRNFTDYLELGVPVAIHGRYIVYIMPLIGALGAAAFASVIPKSLRKYAILGAIILLAMLALGGGWLPFIIRSADSWLWPWAIEPNRVLRSVLWPLIVR